MYKYNTNYRYNLPLTLPLLLICLLIITQASNVNCQSEKTATQSKEAQQNQSDQAWLGISFTDVSKVIAERVGYKETGGTFVEAVILGSPADNAGIKSGDIIIEANGEKIDKYMQIPNMVGKLKPNNNINIKLFRDKKLISIEVTLGKKSDFPKQLLDASKLENETKDLTNQGKYAEAIIIMDNVSQIYEKYFGQKNANYIRSVINLAIFHSELEDWQKSDQLFKKALAISEELFEKTNPFYMLILQRSNLAKAKELNKQAIQLHKQGNNSESVLLFEKALNILEQYAGQRDPCYCRMLSYLATIYHNLGNYEKSEELFKKCVISTRDIFGIKHPYYLQWQQKLAAFYVHTKHNDKAEEIIEECLKISKEIYGERSDEHNQLMINTARLLRSSVKAESLYLDALSIYRNNHGKDETYASILLELSWNVYEFSGEYFREKEILEEALAIFSKYEGHHRDDNVGGKHPLYAQTLIYLARLYRNLGEYKKCESLNLEVLELLQIDGEIGRKGDVNKKILNRNQDIARTIHNSLTNLYVDIGDYGKANIQSQIALKITEEIYGLESYYYGEALDNRARYLSAIHEYEKAATLLKKAADIAKKTKGEKFIDYGTSLLNLANNFFQRGFYEEAKQQCLKAIPILRNSAGDKFAPYLITASLLGQSYARLNDYENANTYLNELRNTFVEVFGEQGPYTQSHLVAAGISYGILKKNREAFDNFIAGLISSDQFISNMSLWATELRLQNYLNTIDERYDYFYSLLSRYYIGTSKEVQHALGVHLSYKGRTIETLATRNRLALISKNPELLKVIEHLKNTTQQISHLSLNPPERLGSKEFKALIEKLDNKKQELEEALARGSAEYADKQALRKLTADDVAASLPESGVYLDFVEYKKYDYDTKKMTDEKRYLAFMLKRDAMGKAVVRIEDLGPSDKIDQMISTLRKELKQEKVPERGVGGKRIVIRTKQTANIVKSDVSTKLYEKVLSPFKEEISKATTLYIAPSGSLNLIPFEVLTEPGQKGYLCDRIPVIYTLGRDLYAAKLKKNQPTEEKTSQQISVIAAPDFSLGKGQKAMVASAKTLDTPRILSRGAVRGWPIKFDDLPGTLEEANAIKKMGGSADIILFVKDKALEENVKKITRPRVLHLATHGFFLDDVARPTQEGTRGVGGIRVTGKGESAVEPPVLKGPVELHDPLLRSGLALAGANRLAENAAIAEGSEDGILTAAEVTGMDLYGTNLVVLSACDTGLGDVHRGNGVSGLRRAFKIAGARNIIMSLWSVPDQETGWLMEEFYRNYFKGDNPAVALNKARATLRQKLIARDGVDHPFYWAAFVLEGSTM